MNSPPSFGDYFKSIRAERQMGLVELSEKSGVSVAQISRIENGKRDNPRPYTIKNLSGALNVPYEEMMRRAGYLNNSDDLLMKLTSLQKENGLLKERIDHLKAAIKNLTKGW